MITVPDTFKGFGVASQDDWSHPKLVEYKRKKMNANDVIVKTICCGICGSDLHTIQGGWRPLQRPDLVVGHEIVGNVIAVGDKVTGIKVGQRVGIGAMSSACGECSNCSSNNEHFCSKGVNTYNSIDTKADGYVTQGGYASHAIAHEQFVFPIPETISSEVAAPLMCAGLTVFSPLVRSLGADATGKTVGIIGIGGLGHLAIQFANALGATVIAFSRSSSKKEDALKMGAHEFIATGEDKDWHLRYAGKLDLVLSCASGIDMDLNPYFTALGVGKELVSVGLPTKDDDFKFRAVTFFGSGAKFATSRIGSKEEALKMFEVAAAKGVKPWIETLPISEENCNIALTKVDKGDVRYRYVLTDYENAFN